MSMSFSHINTILKYHQIPKFHSLLASLNAVKRTYQAPPVPFFKQVEECSSSALLPVVYSIKNVITKNRLFSKAMCPSRYLI